MAGVRDVLVVVPSVAFESVIGELRKFHQENPLRIAWGTKGLHPKTNGFFDDFETLANSVSKNQTIKSTKLLDYLLTRDFLILDSYSTVICHSL